MRLAPFPSTSPWFRRSLEREYSYDDIAAMEPRGATLTGITDRHGVMHTARLTLGTQAVSATHTKAPEAVRQALAKLTVPA